MPSSLIIHTEASRGWGGQEMRTLAECRWFRTQGFEVELIAPPDAQITAAAEKSGFVVHHRILRKKDQLSDLLFCRRLFKSRKPVLVGTHSNIDSRVCLAAATFAGVPNRFRYRHVSIPVRINLWNKVIYRKFATRIVTTASSIASKIQADFNLPDGKALCISTGVDAPVDLPSRDDARLQLCQELNLPGDTRFIGQVSVLRGWKGHEDVMRAFQKIHDTFPTHHLVFIGGGNCLALFQEFAARLDCREKIHFVGQKENPWPYFRALDLNTLASTSSEGIPQTGIQAMLSGTPFLGTTVGGIPEIVRDLETGYLSPAHDPDSLATAMTTILTNQTQTSQTTASALQWSHEHGTLDVMGNKVRDLFV